MTQARGALVLAALAAWSWAEVSWGQTPIRTAGEFLVNAYTTGSQFNGVPAPAPSGNFLIVWNDNHRARLYARLYNRSGAAAGAEFVVNTYSTGSTGRVAIAPDAAGNTAIAWSRLTEESGEDIYVRRFTAGGAPKDAAEFRVNAFTTGSQYAPAAAVDGAGTVIVVWAGTGQDDSGLGIFGRRLDSSGQPVGPDFHVNSYTTADQRRPAVAVDGAGNFIVLWDTLDRGLAGPRSIVAQRYDAWGQRVGGEFQVTAAGRGEQPSVAPVGGGRFIVVWDGAGAGDADGIFARRVDPGGPVGSPSQVNTQTIGSQNSPRVAADAAGNFTVAWGGDSDGGNWGVFGQRYDRSGDREGGQFQVNTFTTGFQTEPIVASQPNGEFVVTWTSPSQDGAASGVFAQRYQPEVVFRDGFEP
jgi:hypothetical protein